VKQLPKLLYRYRALGRLSRGPGSSDPDIVEAAPFIRSALYFPSRLQFNDPCDCLLPDMSHITDDGLREIIRNRAQEEFTELTMAERAIRGAQMARVRRRRIERILQRSVDDLGILSLTTRYNNPVMWASYANDHKGMCLGFETSDDMFHSANPVIYLSKARKYVPNAHAWNAEAFVLTKTREWEHEDEWRVIAAVARRLYPFKAENLKRVIFGTKTSNRDREKVLHWIEQGPSRPHLYRAVLNERSRALDILPSS
jgi:hypothetical protein